MSFQPKNFTRTHYTIASRVISARDADCGCRDITIISISSLTDEHVVIIIACGRLKMLKSKENGENHGGGGMVETRYQYAERGRVADTCRGYKDHHILLSGIKPLDAHC